MGRESKKPRQTREPDGASGVMSYAGAAFQARRYFFRMVAKPRPSIPSPPRTRVEGSGTYVNDIK